MPQYYTATFNQSEHKALNDFIAECMLKYSERLRIEGRSHKFLKTAVTKITNSKTVQLTYK